MKAFTLIEVLLTVALLSIVVLVTSPFMGRFLFAQGLPIAVDELRGSLAKAREYSLLGKNGSQWGVFVSGQTITLFRGDSFASRDASFDETYDIPSQVTLVASDEVVFARVSGVPSTEASYIFSHDSETKNYSLNAAGVLGE